MNQEIRIIYQDEDIIVVNKPAGTLVIPDQHTCESNTLVGMLKSQLKQKMWVIHRIDRDTTGVLMFAKNSQSHRDLSVQFGNSKVHKEYIALVSGVVKEDEGTINKPIFISGRKVCIDKRGTGKKSITNFKTLERFKSYTLVQVQLLTGRRHQIRVHFLSLEHPLAIDGEYGVSEPIILSKIKRNYKIKKGEFEEPLISRLTLHAASLTLILPGSGQEKTFEAPLPKDFEVTLKQLRKYGK
ncbi:MAG: RluA family pseudouridine synthase [Endomicrobium sp.]|jgi:23S rRNA pseudouridine955/2504/2580 synthase/23S rRNA pseudouridine1911/1915/1917 synthase|nr:RluA family pseudouridine synthase [Endomicrobium sp.]